MTTLPGFGPVPGEVHWAFAGASSWTLAVRRGAAHVQVTGERSSDARALAERLGGEALGAGVRLGHLCPRCGSAEHGRPFLLDGSDRVVDGLFVSLSRAGGVQAAALATDPLGIDLEVEAEPDPALALVALHPEEPRWRGVELLRAWVAKEAVLKLLGHGLALDPRSVRLNRDARRAQVSGVVSPLGDGKVIARIEHATLTADGQRFCVARASYDAG